MHYTIIESEAISLKPKLLLELFFFCSIHFRLNCEEKPLETPRNVLGQGSRLFSLLGHEMMKRWMCKTKMLTFQILRTCLNFLAIFTSAKCRPKVWKEVQALPSAVICHSSAMCEQPVKHLHSCSKALSLNKGLN